ncbi:MAG: DNA adenine methylase, partial [Gloeotrichia echinulata HAB0833]
MLFEDYEYFPYPFPEPQYLGAKYIFTGWLTKYLPPNITTALDAFSGSQSVAFALKQRGITTYTNDFLSFNHAIGLALIENKSEKLSAEDIDALFAPQDAPDYTLMEETFANIFFDKEQAQVIDRFRYNTESLNSPLKRALALSVMN